MREIWKSEDNKISNPIGLYDLGESLNDRFAFFSRTSVGDLTVFITKADIINLLEKLKAERIE